MNIVRLTPWDWFGRNNAAGMNVPTRQPGQNGGRGYNPFHEMDRVFDALMGVTDKTAVNADGKQPVSLRPNMDVTGDGKQYTVTVELPGVDENDLRVEMENNSLRIFGEKKQFIEEKNETEETGKYYRMERSYGSFERVIKLPEDVDTGAISAAHKNGVLTVILPRKEEKQPESKVIAINAK